MIGEMLEADKKIPPRIIGGYFYRNSKLTNTITAGNHLVICLLLQWLS